MSTNHPPEQNGVEGDIQTNGEQIYKPRYVDIGINLTDDTYSGLYHDTQRHPSDIYEVIERAKSVGCSKLIVTGSDVENSKRAVGLAAVFPGTVYATVGIHPCNSSPFSDSSSSSSDTATILSALQDLATNSASEVVAYGELGLDYDRLSHCSKEVQIASFNAQLDLFAALPPTLQKPLFLHSRAAHADFAAILRERIEKGELGRRGVVHSFTGTEEEMLELVTMGFDIGVNGCSLKTEENCAVVRGIPLSRLQLETDGPWCEMRPTHAGTKYAEGAGYVETVGAGMEASKADKGGWKSVKKEKWVHGALIKGRNESCLIPRVGWAVAGVKGVGVREVCEAAWENSSRMFGIGDEVNGAAVASGKGADNTP